MESHFLWAIIGGFLSGVALRSVVPLGYAFAGFLAVVGLAVLLVSLGRDTSLRLAAVVAAAFLASAMGVARMNLSAVRGDPTLTARLDEKVVLEGEVSAEPDRRETSVRLPLAARLLVASTSEQVAGGVLAVLPAHTAVSYGDVVKVSGTLRAPQAFDSGEGRQFDYPDYLAASGIAYELSYARLEKVEERHGNPAQAFAIGVKERFLAGLRDVLSEPEAGLAGGITVGDKRSIGDALSRVFRQVGLVHIVVLSGYNITVVVNAVAKLLSRAPRFARFGATSLVVSFFILMSGGAASASRAGAMALVAALARATGRTFHAARALGAAAFLIVLWNPLSLVFDPGFQLSALATAGLVFLTPLFDARLGWVPARFGLREIASSTLSTQLAVLPLLLYQNGQLSLYALPANLLALSAIPPAMLFSSLSALAGFIFGTYAAPLALPAYVLLAYVIDVAKLLAALPFSSLTVPVFGIWWMLAAYLFLVGATFFLRTKDLTAKSIAASQARGG